jgi:hypothetical protein
LLLGFILALECLTLRPLNPSEDIHEGSLRWPCLSKGTGNTLYALPGRHPGLQEYTPGCSYSSLNGGIQGDSIGLCYQSEEKHIRPLSKNQFFRPHLQLKVSGGELRLIKVDKGQIRRSEDADLCKNDTKEACHFTGGTQFCLQRDKVFRCPILGGGRSA